MSACVYVSRIYIYTFTYDNNVRETIQQLNDIICKNHPCFKIFINRDSQLRQSRFIYSTLKREKCHYEMYSILSVYLCCTYVSALGLACVRRKDGGGRLTQFHWMKWLPLFPNIHRSFCNRTTNEKSRSYRFVCFSIGCLS